MAREPRVRDRARELSGGSPREGARSEERAELRLAAGGRRLPRPGQCHRNASHGLPRPVLRTVRRLPRPVKRTVRGLDCVYGVVTLWL
jgi:hypothetical protein